MWVQGVYIPDPPHGMGSGGTDDRQMGRKDGLIENPTNWSKWKDVNYTFLLKLRSTLLLWTLVLYTRDSCCAALCTFVKPNVNEKELERIELKKQEEHHKCILSHSFLQILYTYFMKYLHTNFFFPGSPPCNFLHPLPDPRHISSRFFLISLTSLTSTIHTHLYLGLSLPSPSPLCESPSAIISITKPFHQPLYHHTLFPPHLTRLKHLSISLWISYM